MTERDRAAEVIGAETGEEILDEALPEVLRTRWTSPGERRWLDEVPAKRLSLLSRQDVGGDWIDFLPLGKVGMFAAGGGVGKTGVLVQLALAVATGAPWLGQAFRVDRPGRVLLVLGEEDEAEAHRRLYWSAKNLELTEEQRELVARRLIVVPGAGVDVALTRAVDPREGNVLPETPLAGALMRRLNTADDDWSLVVLDPLSRFAGPDVETDNAAATRFVQVLERLTTARGTPTVLVAHHTTKAQRREGTHDDTGARGASALSDGMRWHATLSHVPHPAPSDGRFARLPELAHFSLVKSNYSKRTAEPMLLERDRHGLLSVASAWTCDLLEQADGARVEAQAQDRAESEAALTRARVAAKRAK